MSIKKILTGNELLTVIISIRIDTLWKMLMLKKENQLPEVNEEGATGKLDNKGAIFLPGGLVHQDEDEQDIYYEIHEGMNGTRFREEIKFAMRYDNATLLYPNGLAPGVNLDSGFFSKAARQILTYKKAAYRRKRTISKGIVDEVSVSEIIRSHCPPYMEPPYGSRTRISTCLSIGLVDPPVFFAYCRDKYHLFSERSGKFAERLNKVFRPVFSRDKKILYPPFVVVCHDTRYLKNSITGLTRILGIGKFGEFATLTIEKVSRHLILELKRNNQEFKPEDRCAEFEGHFYAVILRIYTPTNPGKRSRNHTLHLISPHKELGINTAQIEKIARQRYHFR